MSILRPNRRKDRNKDALAREFMLFVKGFPCIVCEYDAWALALYKPGTLTPWWLRSLFHGTSEFAHIGGNAAAKASNWSGIPLCSKHHRTGPDSQEKLKARFGAHHGIDVDRIIAELVELFKAEIRERME